jgi:hypothetical protein
MYFAPPIIPMETWSSGAGASGTKTTTFGWSSGEIKFALLWRQ